MAWTKEVKEKRVAAAEEELEKAEKWLAAYTEEELKRRRARVARAKHELEWTKSALVEGEELE